MHSFLRTNGSAMSEENITTIEKNYGFSFPMAIRHFYLKHNGAKIKEMHIKVDGDMFDVVRFLDLATVCMLLAENSKHFIRSSNIPFAEDWGDNMFCWNKEDGKVYLVFLDSEEPLFLANSVDNFWNMLENSNI